MKPRRLEEELAAERETHGKTRPGSETGRLHASRARESWRRRH